MAADPDREKLARVIDPGAWESWGFALVERVAQRDRALAKADAILALLAPRLSGHSIQSDEPSNTASVSASPAADEWPRLPDWNDLANEQRRALVAEGEYWCEHFGGDCALNLYQKIRELVLVPPPPLLATLAAGQSLTEASEDGSALQDGIAPPMSDESLAELRRIAAEHDRQSKDQSR